MTEANEKTDNLLDAYMRSLVRHETAKQEVTSAEVEMNNARNALGNHLVPKDAAAGEVFSIWVRIAGEEKLLSVNVVGTSGSGSYAIFWRKPK
jgi:protein subunit release factor A